MVSVYRIELCIWCNHLVQRWFALRLPDEGAFVTLEVAFDDGRSGFRGGGCRRRQSHRYPCSASIPLSFPKETFYGVGGPSLPSPHEGEGLERPQVTRCEPCDLQRKTHWSTLKVSSIQFIRSFSWNFCQLLIWNPDNFRSEELRIIFDVSFIFSDQCAMALVAPGGCPSAFQPLSWRK